MDYSSILQSMMQKGSATDTGVGQIQAQRPQAVPYAQPPQMGPLSQQAYAMAGPAPQIAQPPPPMMGTPNRPGFPGGAPQIPQIPGMHIPGVPMRDPMQILRMLRGHGMGGGMY